ncbi:hypothetical protein [Metabacillus sp. RGM 3146]|uniref:hypothetical protein n=1 Tax=Metabacillus sp. RGM 3146 TaxID=3401092 RepID=UPI003B9C7885
MDLTGLYRVEQDEVVILLKLFQVLSLMGTELILTGVSSELILSTSSELVSGFSNIRNFMAVIANKRRSGTTRKRLKNQGFISLF